MRFEYFISFKYFQKNREGFGNTSVILNGLVLDYKHIQRIEDEVCITYDFKRCILMSYNLIAQLETKDPDQKCIEVLKIDE